MEQAPGQLRPLHCTYSTVNDADAALEAAISAAKDRMCAAPTREGKLEHWREMVRLIDQRTPHRVRFMQRMRGLA